MDRRQFLRSTSVATVGGFSLSTFSNPLLAALAGRSDTDRVLVIVQLIGGNDGLNTVIPVDQYANLATARPALLIPESAVLPLSGLGGATGLHPTMGGMRDLWEDGKLAIVQGVSHPQPNFSHFRATDIWETGSDSEQVLDSGWAARYLDHTFPNYPAGYPNPDMPDPLAIRVGGTIGPGLQHLGVSMGVAINNTDNPVNLASNIYIDPLTEDCRGDKLAHVRMVQQQSSVYGSAINAAAAEGCNMSSLYPTGNAPGAQLAQALKIVAQLICGGLKTPIYWVSIGGFDTHALQVVAGQPEQGAHAQLLQGLSDAVHAFQDDLQLLGLEDRVLGMTFSEFGRRIIGNASLGTDHGSALPMFLFGSQVLPGRLGTNPEIPPDANAQTNLAMQYDFRSVYASVLRDWFCLPQGEVDAVLLNNFQPLSLIDPAGCLGLGIQQANQGAGETLLEVYPNPFVERTTLRYTAHGGRVLLQVFNEQGQLLRTLFAGNPVAGTHLLDVDLGELPAGRYYVRLQSESRQQVRSAIKVR
jgi:uncharacterized protein (DUF1501 family)